MAQHAVPWPGCSGLRHKVISKALTAGGDLDKRRVECLTCGRRFTTRESVDLRLLRCDLFRLEEAAATGTLDQSAGLGSIEREPSRNSMISLRERGSNQLLEEEFSMRNAVPGWMGNRFPPEVALFLRACGFNSSV
jgi:hypothetical protein